MKNPMFMNPNMYGGQPGMANPYMQQEVGYGPGYGPEEMTQGMNFPQMQMGYPMGPTQNMAGHMMDNDCGCGEDHHEGPAMPAGVNPYGPAVSPSMMGGFGPHGPGCGCGQQQGPMAAPMTGGFGPQGPSPGMMGGFGPQGPNPGMMGGFGPQGPAPGMMGGFGPQGPNPGMMSGGFGPHGPGCTCGQPHGQMGGFGPQGPGLPQQGPGFGFGPGNQGR
ncbi:hypothetical protein [Ferdinandcohnia sp. Marseille-Q9671]